MAYTLRLPLSTDPNTMKETFAEWQQRTRTQGFYKLGFSVAFTFIAEMLFVLRDPVDPDMGLGALGGLIALAAAVLWFIGFWDYTRSKGYPEGYAFLSLLHMVGLVIMMALPETWEAFGPRQRIMPSAQEPKKKVEFRKQRTDW